MSYGAKYTETRNRILDRLYTELAETCAVIADETDWDDDNSDAVQDAMDTILFGLHDLDDRPSTFVWRTAHRNPAQTS